MRITRDLLVIGGIAVSLALPQLALSADTNSGAATKDKAKIDETRHHDRGFAFTPLNETGGGQAPANVTAPVKKPETKNAGTSATSKNLTGSNVSHGIKKEHLILTAVKKQKHNTTGATQTAVSHPSGSQTTAKTNTAASQPNTSLATTSKFTASEGGPVISARLDRNGTLPVYKVGDKMTVKVKANQDCNVVVFNYDSTGTLTQIFPNDYQQDGFIKAGESIEIGGAESPFDYQIAGKGGPEKVFVYAYPTGGDLKNPLTAMGAGATKVAMAPISGTPFRGTEMTVDEYRKLVNSSQIFFSRSIEVKPRTPHSAQLVSAGAPPQSPNKVELTFNVEK